MEMIEIKTAERRQSRERRKTVASPFTYHRLIGRRRLDRRGTSEVTAANVIDTYPIHLIFITISILLLCALDAHNTLLLLQKGAVELNPLMDVVIQQSSHLFIASKFSLTGLAVIILVSHHRERFFFRLFKARQALYFSLSLYIVLIAYQWSIFPGGAFNSLAA